MPFCLCRVNVPVSREQEHSIKARFGEAVAHALGLDEKYLLLGIESGCRLYLRGGGDDPVAYVEVNVFGNEQHRGYDRLTKEITQLFHAVLSIPPGNIYVKYSDISCWGVGGMTFDNYAHRMRSMLYE